MARSCSSTWQNKSVIKSLVIMGSSVPGRGVTLSTSLEEVHDHDKKAKKCYWIHWFVSD
jgi:hypothetical protein